MMAKPDPTMDNLSFQDLLGLCPVSPSPAPPTAPSLPQEELWLLHTSFDMAFASLAGCYVATEHEPGLRL